MIFIKEKISGIYKIENMINHKVYIGKSIDIYQRWVAHKSALNSENYNHINMHLQNAWNKYGEKTFEFSVIEECEGQLQDEREIYYIALYRSNLPEFGYNKTLGGDGVIPTEETRQKMAEAP